MNKFKCICLVLLTTVVILNISAIHLTFNMKETYDEFGEIEGSSGTATVPTKYFNFKKVFTSIEEPYFAYSKVKNPFKGFYKDLFSDRHDNYYLCINSDNASPIPFKRSLKLNKYNWLLPPILPGYRPPEGYRYTLNTSLKSVKIGQKLQHNQNASLAKVTKSPNCSNYENIKAIHTYNEKYLSRENAIKKLRKSHGYSYVQISNILGLKLNGSSTSNEVSKTSIIKNLDRAIANGFKINTADRFGDTLISKALYHKREQLIDEFIKRGASLKFAWEQNNGNKGWFILYKLGEINRFDLIQKAFDEGIDINKANPSLNTNVFRNEKIAQLAIQNGLDLCALKTLIHNSKVRKKTYLSSLKQRVIEECSTNMDKYLEQRYKKMNAS